MPERRASHIHVVIRTLFVDIGAVALWRLGLEREVAADCGAPMSTVSNPSCCRVGSCGSVSTAEM
jgi:hypothetical protein